MLPICLAILKLSRLVVGEKIKPVCLPESSYVLKSFGRCFATGWGRASSQGPLTATLLEAQIPILENKICSAKYGQSVPIRSGHLCAGRLDGTTGTCVVGLKNINGFVVK
jgi:plasminogen